MPSDDGGPAIAAAYWIPFTFAILTFCARMVCRIKFVGYVGPDDWAMVLTMFTATVSSVLMTVAVHEGLGQHIWKLQPEQSFNAVTYSWIAQAFSIFTFAISKISISLFLLLRVIGAARLHWHKIFLYFVMISLPIVNTVVVVLVFTQCRPVRKLSDPASPGHCWNPHITTVYAQFSGAYSAMTDLGLVLFAVWIIWNLHMSWKVKARLCCMLSLGIFAAGCAVAKTYYLSEHDHEAVNDFTYGQTNLLIWTALEQYVIIIGANIPCVQPLVVALLHKVKSLYSHERTTHYPLDDMRVHPSQSLESSSNATLTHYGGGGYEESSAVSDQSAGNDHPVFLDLAPRISKAADMDVRLAGGSPGLGGTSRIV